MIQAQLEEPPIAEVHPDVKTALCPGKSRRQKGGVCTLCYPPHDEMEREQVSVWLPSQIGAPSWENGVLFTHEDREPVVL